MLVSLTWQKVYNIILLKFLDNVECVAITIMCVPQFIQPLSFSWILGLLKFFAVEIEQGNGTKVMPF